MVRLPADIKGVFFDLYGTLIIYGDMTAAWKAWFELLFETTSSLVPNLKRARLAEYADVLFEGPNPEVGSSNLTNYERRLLGLVQDIGGEIDRQNLADLADDSIRVWQRFLPLDGQTPEVLRTLEARGVTMALVSNFDHPPHIHNLLRRHELVDFFSHITISAEVGRRKPDPAIFTDALESTELRAGQVAYVGDAEVDIEAAAGCGMTPVIIRRRGALPRESAKDPLPESVVLISQLRDLMALVST